MREGVGSEGDVCGAKGASKGRRGLLPAAVVNMAGVTTLGQRAAAHAQALSTAQAPSFTGVYLLWKFHSNLLIFQVLKF